MGSPWISSGNENNKCISEGFGGYDSMSQHPNSPYQGNLGWSHDDSYYSQEGDMPVDDGSSIPFDPSTININDILGIATAMVNNQSGTMDIN